MSDQEQLSFSCSACGRQFAWKPAIAGRQAKCKCGQAVQAPLKPPFAQASPQPRRQPQPKPAPPAAATTCPSCSADLDAGAVLCLACGYVLPSAIMPETVMALTPAPAPSPAARSTKHAPPAPNTPRPRRPQQAHTSNNAKVAIICGVLLAVLAGGIIASKSYLKENRQPAKPLLAQDASALNMLKEQNPVEARKYLAMHPSYMLGAKWTKRQSEYKVDEWYRMGAKTVWAFTGIISAHVVIELAPEPEKRRELFDWAKRWDEERLRPVQVDVGQDYLIINLM